MSTFLAIASLLLIAAVTPGPNNIVMMRTGARRGMRGAWPAMVGVLLGGSVMLALTVTGLGALLTRWPMLRMLVAIGGGVYLVWLGWRLMTAVGRDGRDGDVELPAGIVGLFAFQFLNPKAWVMLLTVVATLPPQSALHAFACLAPIFVCISAACLVLWSSAGRILARAMGNPSIHTRIDRVLGASLIASTLLLYH